MIKNGMEITLDTFMDVYRNGFKANTITILQLFREHNAQFEKKITKGIIANTTLDKYNVTRDYLAAYIKTLKKNDVMVKDITPNFVEDFFVFLLKSMSNNTAIQKMKQLWDFFLFNYTKILQKLPDHTLDGVKQRAASEG